MSNAILGSTAPEAIEIGRTFAGERIRTNRDHLILFGGTGSGKSAGVIMPNLLDMSGDRSIVVVDPSGELAAVSAEWRGKPKNQGGAGNRVVILNPFGVLTEYYEDMQGVGFNPLPALDPDSDDFDEDAALLAEAMITITPGKEAHWDESAHALVTAIIMYVVLIARQNGKIPTMARVRELLCLPSEAPNRFVPGDEGKGIPKLAQVMMRSGRPGLCNLAGQFTDWYGEIKSIRSNAMRQTKCFDAPQIARNIARNDFDFRDLKREPTTVYIVIPPHQMERHGKWVRLLLTSALRASMRPRQAGEPTILYICDEIAQLGNLRILTTVFTQVRKYGIQMLCVFQDMLQGKDIYKDRWGSFLANAGALLFFRPNDPTTAEWLSKRLGETTRLLQTLNEQDSQSGGTNSGRSTNDSGGGSASGGLNAGWSLSRSINTSPVKVPLTLPHELYGLKAGEMRAFLTGVKDGLTLTAPPYFEIRSRDLRARDNPYVHPVPRRPSLPSPSPLESGDGWATGGKTVDLFSRMFGGERRSPGRDESFFDETDRR